MLNRSNSSNATEAKSKYFTILNILALCFLFLGAADVINRYYYFVYFAFLFFFIQPKRKLALNSSCFLLFFLGISIFLFNPNSRTSITNMIRPFTYFLCFFMGYNIFRKKSFSPDCLHRREFALRASVLVFGFGTFFHFVLNMIKNRGLDNRHVMDFWTNREMSATGQATLACIALVIAASWLFSKSKKIQKILAVVIIATAIAYNFILAGRTIFIFIFLVLMLAFVHQSIALKRPFLKIVLILLLIALAVFLVYRFDLFGIRTAFEHSNFYNRFFGENNQEIDSDQRMTHKLYYLKHFTDHLFGGNHINNEYGHSAHDLYLDTHSESGIFAFLSVSCYIIVSIRRLTLLLRNQKLTFQTRQLLFCFYVLINIQFFVEPILRGMPWLFATYCFVDGNVANLLEDAQRC